MHYAVVIDAGSSGSRVFVYSWPEPEEYTRDLLPNSVLRQSLLPITSNKDWVQKVKPGISSYVGEPAKHVFKQHLRPLLRKAQQVVPRDQQKSTPIYFLATAGLRLVEEEERQRLLSDVCESLKQNSQFHISSCAENVAMIDGQSEGIYGWLGLNYLVHWGLARQWTNFEDTYGFLDMGGASAQLAYASSANSAHLNDLHSVRIRTASGESIEWHVFVATWLGYGANQARERFRALLAEQLGEEELERYKSEGLLVPAFDPCLPVAAHYRAEVNGTEFQFEGSGNWQQCEQYVAKLLRIGVPCEDEPCLFDGRHVPDFDLHNNRFVGVSEYWYTIHDLFGTHGRFDYSQIEPKVADLCGADWSTIKSRLDAGEFMKSNGERFSEQELQAACFKSAWVLSVLRKGFKFPLSPENDSLHHNFQDTFQSALDVEGAEISWTLGRAVLYAASEIPPVDESKKVGITLLDGSFVPGGGTAKSEPAIPDIRSFDNNGGVSFLFLFLLFLVISSALLLVGIVHEDSKWGRILDRWPPFRRFKRRVRSLWARASAADMHMRTASRIGYGYSYPHAGIPLSTLSQESTGSRPQFRSPSRMGSSTNLADHDTYTI